MKRRRRTGGWIEGELTADSTEKVDFDAGLPSTAKQRSKRRRKTAGVALGKGKYRDEFDFESGLPEVKVKVNITKAAYYFWSTMMR